MKKLTLNKQTIARLNNPDKIYGGADTDICVNPGKTGIANTCQDNTCIQPCATSGPCTTANMQCAQC